VRLIQEKDNTQLLLNNTVNLFDDQAMHGPAVMSSNKTFFSKFKYSLRNDAMDTTESERFKITSYDNVHAVHCPY